MSFFATYGTHIRLWRHNNAQQGIHSAVNRLLGTFFCAKILLVVLAISGVSQSLAAKSLINLQNPGSVSKVRLVLDKSVTLSVSRSVAEALVANPAIADVVPLTHRSVYLVGKKIGLTRLTFLDSEKQLIGIVELEVSYDIKALKTELRRNIPDGNFLIRTANGRIILSGEVADAIALGRATDITRQFANDQFLNSMTVRAPQQVLLEVRFVEAQRTAARDLGLSWDFNSSGFRGRSGGIAIGDLLTGATLLTGFPSNNIPFGTFITRILNNGLTADAVIQALEKRGVARRLAEPNLVTLSGDTASFLAGGEFPFPVAADDGQVSIEFKKFGVGLAFTPTVLSNGQINLKIEPEVSDLDFTNEIRIAGIAIPSLVVRRASTTVELRDGQSFAIAGLLQTTNNKSVLELPWIGQVPVLGALFRSVSYDKKESDLVIIVTPRLVSPAPPGQKLLTPLDQKLSGNDRDLFLLGRMEINKKLATGQGHILDVDGGWDTTVDDEYDVYK